VASAYHLFVKDLRDLMIVLSHDLLPSFFFL
jgi:hypothetical protein